MVGHGIGEISHVFSRRTLLRFTGAAVGSTAIPGAAGAERSHLIEEQATPSSARTPITQTNLTRAAESRPKIKMAVRESAWRRVDRELPGHAPKLLWKGDPLVAPRGIVKLGDALYITDPGIVGQRDKNPARIVKVPLIGGEPGEPKIFFQRKGFFLSGKWSVPAGGDDNNSIHALVVADQGEEVVVPQPTSGY